MFREITRSKQKISKEECDELLARETRGILALNAEDGYPVALPMNHFYEASENTVYFHCGRSGYKLDCLRASDKACFTVTELGQRHPGEWWLTAKSVVVQGRIEIIDDHDKIRFISEKLCRKFTNDTEYIESEITRYIDATLLLALHIEHMTGKTVREK